MQRRAGKLAVGQGDAVILRSHRHLLEVFGADLMAEAARAAVNAHDDVVERDTDGARHRIVVDRSDLLHLEIMIAGAQRAHLVGGGGGGGGGGGSRPAKGGGGGGKEGRGAGRGGGGRE